MRIAVASDDGVAIAGHFGRCAGFEIFEVAGNEATKIERRPNTNSHHHDGQGDCNHHGHDNNSHNHESFLLALRDCQAVICHGMGRRAVADLAARGIRPVITRQDVPAQEAVRLYAAGQLSESGGSQCCSH